MNYGIIGHDNIAFNEAMSKAKESLNRFFKAVTKIHDTNYNIDETFPPHINDNKAQYYNRKNKRMIP